MAKNRYWLGTVFPTELADLSVIGDEGIVIPGGGAADRPVTPSEGTIRLNTDIDRIEVFQGNNWFDITTSATSGYNMIGFTGSAESIIASSSLPLLEFKTIRGGTNIGITDTGDELMLSAIGSASGEPNSAITLGAGISVFAGKVGPDLTFNSLSTGTPTLIDISLSGAGEIDIDFIGDTGETNTVSTLGTGVPLFDSKVGTEFRFRSIRAASTPIGVVLNGDNIEVSFSNNATLPGTGAITVPVGTSAQRPAGSNGMLRYNTTTDRFDVYEDGSWVNLLTTSTGALSVTGGTMTGDLTMSASDIILDNNRTVDGRDVSADGALLDNINAADGFITRIAANTFAQRAIEGTANEITVANVTGLAGNPIIGISDNPIIGGTESITIPTGTTGQRPAGAQGMIRVNSSDNRMEFYSGGAWIQTIDSASGSTITTAAPLSGDGSGGDPVTLDISGVPVHAGLTITTDLLLLYDASATSHVHASIDDIAAGAITGSPVLSIATIDVLNDRIGMVDISTGNMAQILPDTLLVSGIANSTTRTSNDVQITSDLIGLADSVTGNMAHITPSNLVAGSIALAPFLFSGTIDATADRVALFDASTLQTAQTTIGNLLVAQMNQSALIDQTGINAATTDILVRNGGTLSRVTAGDLIGGATNSSPALSSGSIDINNDRFPVYDTSSGELSYITSDQLTIAQVNNAGAVGALETTVDRIPGFDVSATDNFYITPDQLVGRTINQGTTLSLATVNIFADKIGVYDDNTTLMTNMTPFGLVLSVLNSAPAHSGLDASADKVIVFDQSATTGVSATISDLVNLTPQVIAMACSDETTDLTVTSAVTTFRMPYAMNLTEVRASVTTAPSGSTMTIDINEGGASIFSTPLTIDDGESSSVSAATPAVLSDTALANDAQITVDIDQVGAVVPGTGLKIYLIGTIA